MGCIQPQPPVNPISNNSQVTPINPANPKNLPPLEISLIDFPSQSKASQLTIHGILSRNATLTINGNPVKLADRSFTYNLNLDEGSNRFVFEATDQYGNKNTVVKMITYATDKPNLTSANSTVYVPANGTVGMKSIHVEITVVNLSTLIGFNVTSNSTILNLGSISPGKSSARLVILSNEQDSLVYVHFNSTGNISGLFEYPEPFNLFKLGEKKEIWVKAIIPENTAFGTYSGEFLIQEIREKGK